MSKAIEEVRVLVEKLTEFTKKDILKWEPCVLTSYQTRFKRWHIVVDHLQGDYPNIHIDMGSNSTELSGYFYGIEKLIQAVKEQWQRQLDSMSDCQQVIEAHKAITKSQEETELKEKGLAGELGKCVTAIEKHKNSREHKSR